VINTIEQFGRNAGKIYETLSQHGALTPNEIQKNVQLREYEINIGIGWLARENKIAQHNETYCLSETNLTDKIGSSAGVIYDYLTHQKEIDLSNMIQTIQIDESTFYQAIGWLAREDNIQFHSKKP
jgi:hypothetical protein